MHLFLDQLVYTSFAGMGFRLLASPQVPAEIQQAFQSLTSKHWDTYNPPRFGYQAVYLHQVTPEQSLFGWLHNDGADDMGRANVPYFICYYLAKPLNAFQLENIFACLQKGPVALIDRHSLPASLETIVVPDLLSYQGARPGVAIPEYVCKRSYIALKQGELLDLFVQVTEQEIVIEQNAQSYEQQIANSSIYTSYLVEGTETVAADLKNPGAIKTGIIKSYHNEILQIYEQALVSAIGRQYPISENTRKTLKRLQQVLRLTDKDIEPIEARIFGQTKAVQREEVAEAIRSKDIITATGLNKTVAVNEADTRSLKRTILSQILFILASFNIDSDKSANHNSVLAYRNSQLLLKVSIAATVLALTGSIYGLIQASNFVPINPNFNRSPSSRVFYKTLAAIPNVSPNA